MLYTFSCPAPCKKIVQIEAFDDEEAIDKIIIEGAMLCRNMKSNVRCSESPTLMSPLSDMHLREVIRLSMQADKDSEIKTPLPPSDRFVPKRVHTRS